MDKLDSFTRAYMECALWSTTVENPAGSCGMDELKDITDIAPETLQKMTADCAKFQGDNLGLIEGDKPALTHESDCHAQAGCDFWLTRNHHGAGFWDGDWPTNGDKLTAACKAYPEMDLYIGDDGKIYC